MNRRRGILQNFSHSDLIMQSGKCVSKHGLVSLQCYMSSLSFCIECIVFVLFAHRLCERSAG